MAKFFRVGNAMKNYATPLPYRNCPFYARDPLTNGTSISLMSQRIPVTNPIAADYAFLAAQPTLTESEFVPVVDIV